MEIVASSEQLENNINHFYHSPIRKSLKLKYYLEVKQNSNESSNIKFAIRPFNIEWSTAATTSHSTRGPEGELKSREIDSPLESILKLNDEGYEKNNVSNSSPKYLKEIKPWTQKDKKESFKINFKIWSEFKEKPKLNFNRIKLKFKRDKQESFNYSTHAKELDHRIFELDSPIKKFESEKMDFLRDSPFKTRESWDDNLPRKTAYFGRHNA